MPTKYLFQPCLLVGEACEASSHTMEMWRAFFSPQLEEMAQGTATTLGTSSPTLFQIVCRSLRSHIEGIVRQGLRFIFLIQEDLKV